MLIGSWVQTLCCPAKQVLTPQEQWLHLIIQGQNLVTAVASVMDWEGEWFLRQSWGRFTMCKGVFYRNPGTLGVPKNPTDTQMCCAMSHPAVSAGVLLSAIPGKQSQSVPGFCPPPWTTRVQPQSEPCIPVAVCNHGHLQGHKSKMCQHVLEINP